MKVFLKRRLNVFPKLRRRLSSVKWILLVATTAMFFLSTFSSGCDGLTLSFGPVGPTVGQQPTQPAVTTMPSVSPLTGAGTPAPGSVALGGGTPPSLAMGGGTPPSVAMGGGTPPAGSPGGSSAGPGSSPGGAAQVVTIAQGPPTASDPSGFIFKPATLTIKKGTMVTWQNPTKAPHTVTADDGSFDSGNLPAGKSFSFTFSKTGTFTYTCQVHPGQMGTVNVQ